MHTLESLLKLAETDEGRDQIRILVAEHVGYFNILRRNPLHFGLFGTIRKERPKRPGGAEKEYEETVNIPNFCFSLDAMAEAEKMLNENERGDFINHLCNVAHQVPEQPGTAVSKAFFASAAHRAIAFILTKQGGGA